jgi:hypothetical protein
MTLVRIVLIAILAGGSAYWYLDNRSREKETEKRHALDAARNAGFKGFELRTPNPTAATDSGMLGLPSGYRPSVSPWDSAEKARYRALFPENSFEVLIVPFQVSKFALDRSTRSLMFAQLSMAVRESGIAVPDPYLVLRALGENRRQFKPEEVYEFARHLGAKRVIWTYAGHDRKNSMSMEFRIKDRERDGGFGEPSIRSAGSFDKIPFTAESPPIVAYQLLLPQIVERLGYKPRAPAAKRASQFDALALPASPSAMVAEQADPAKDAYYFLTFAALTPASAQRTRERFVEKAFLAALPLAEDYPDFRLLRARTFMLMGLRPAALHALGPASTEEEKALAAMLNGNLPQVADATVHVKPMLKKILAELDFARIRTEYGDDNNGTRAAALKRLAPPGTIWPLFVDRALSDGDFWKQFDNFALKELLDAEFPIQGFTAAGIVGGSVAVADQAKLRSSIDFSVYNHVKQALEKEAAQLCCVTDPAHLSTLDYFDLVEAIGFDNLGRRANLRINVQGSSQDGLAELARLESVYKGHPHFSLLRAQAERSVARKADGAAKEGLLRSAFANAFDAFYGEQGQTADAADAFNLIQALNRKDFGDFNNVYVSDIPFRSFYPTWEYANTDLALKSARAALENSTFDGQPVYDFGAMLAEQQQKDAEFGEILKSLEGRYAGYTYLSVLRGDVNIRLGNIAQAEAEYREAIKSQRLPWQAYKALAHLMFWQGRVEESAKLLRGYPGFAPGADVERVELANEAFQAASDYYSNGDFELARPFYAISAKLGTGAASSMTSEARLKLLAGDYAGSLQGTYARATRYGDPAAYRDYLSFLHVAGYSKEAWDGFNVLVRQQSQPDIWESALVGHRLAGASEQEMLAWAGQDALRSVVEYTSYSARYLLRAAVTDRVPAESTAVSIGKVDRPAWKVAGTYNYTVKDSADGLKHYVLGPVGKESNFLQPGLFEQSQKTRVKSDLEYFARGYRLLRTGDYEGARVVLEEAATLFDLTQNSMGHMLPYLAFAAAKSTNTVAVESAMARFKPMEQNFDYFLAKAVMLGIAQKPDEAIPMLKLAQVRRPFSEYRAMHPDYEYAELVELLFESTGNVRYRNLVLDWVRKCEKKQPWYSWAYAMDAKLSADGADRRRAIAMAYYLDGNSERLKGFQKRDVENTVKEFGHRNPFLNMKETKLEKPI